MKLKIDLADHYFSYYIRLRDTKCLRCGSLVVINLETGLPKSHTLSHYFGRGRESTRFDEDNCITLCMGCHRIWGSDDREAYRTFMINWLGQKRFDALTIRANQYKKKDRKMAYITAKALLNDLLKNGK